MPETAPSDPWEYSLYIPNDPRAVTVCRRTLRLILTMHGLIAPRRHRRTARHRAGLQRRTAHQGPRRPPRALVGRRPADRGVGRRPRTARSRRGGWSSSADAEERPGPRPGPGLRRRMGLAAAVQVRHRGKYVWCELRPRSSLITPNRKGVGLSRGGRRPPGSARDGALPAPRGPGGIPARGGAHCGPPPAARHPRRRARRPWRGRSAAHCRPRPPADTSRARGAVPCPALSRVPVSLLGDIVVHTPGHACVERHAPRRGRPGAERPWRRRSGRRSPAVRRRSRAVSGPRPRGRGCLRGRFLPDPLLGIGSDEDDRPLGPCDDGQADVSQEVAFHRLQPP